MSLSRTYVAGSEDSASIVYKKKICDLYKEDINERYNRSSYY